MFLRHFIICFNIEMTQEENNVLKVQNENLCHKLRRAESFLALAKEELAHYRACNGSSPYINFDEEQRLKNKIKVSFGKFGRL